LTRRIRSLSFSRSSCSMWRICLPCHGTLLAPAFIGVGPPKTPNLDGAVLYLAGRKSFFTMSTGALMIFPVKVRVRFGGIRGTKYLNSTSSPFWFRNVARRSSVIVFVDGGGVPLPMGDLSSSPLATTSSISPSESGTSPRGLPYWFVCPPGV